MIAGLRIGFLACAFGLCGVASAGIITVDPSLPPTIGAYRTPAQVHAEYLVPGADIVLSDVAHFGFTNVVRFGATDEMETFDSTVTGNVTFNGGPPIAVMLVGSVQTEVFGKVGNTTGTFNTEMLQLNLSGGGILVRESPTLASTGQTTIADLGGGSFRIDSFFDVFTELSLDGGRNWSPSIRGPARVELVAEPGALALLGLGLAGLGLSRRRQA